METKKILKEILLSVIVYSLIAFACWTITLFIGISLIDNNQVVFGTVSIIIGIILIVFSTVKFIINMVKLNKKLRLADKENILKLINLTENKNEFLSLNNEKIMFYSDYLMFENEMINYESLNCYFAFNIKKSFFTEKTLVIKFFNDEVAFSIKVDQDILKTLENKKINIENNLDYLYFLNNTDECLKIMNKIISLNPNMEDVFLFFAKDNEEKIQEKKIKRKNNINSIIAIIVMLILSIGFIAITTWLSDSKDGVAFSNNIKFDLIVKIIFSIVVALCFFVKPKKFNIYTRLTFIAFLLFYWAGIFFFDDRLNQIVIHVFTYLFLIIGITKLRTEYKNSENKKSLNPFNRFIAVGAFLALAILYFVYDIGYSNDYIFLYGLIISVFISLIAMLVISIKYKKNKSNKKNFILAMVLIPICLLTIGTASVSFEIMSINYMFDYSDGVEYIVIVKKLDDDEDYSEAKVYFEIDGVEYNVGISQEEYFNLKIGDYIKVIKYNGFLNLTYVIYDSKVMG